MSSYIAEGDAVDYIGLSAVTSSAFLMECVGAASALIDDYCARVFGQVGAVGTPTERRFDVPSGEMLEFGPYCDLAHMSELRLGESQVDVSAVQLGPTGADNNGRPWTSLRLVGATWPPVTGRTDLVVVSGVWGWPAVPVEVKAACRLITAELVKLRDAPLGSFAGGMDMGSVYTRRDIPARARSLLDPLRHPMSFGIG